MRLRDAEGRLAHLSYCTNVHPAEDLGGIIAQCDTYALAVRERLGTDVLALGLWLAAPVAAELAASQAKRRRLRRELDLRGLEVVTLNGFPYQAFQAPVVKHAVYQPDWTTPDRLEYTVHLATILADLLPEDAARGSISTLPLAWRVPWNAIRAQRCRQGLDQLAAELAALHRRTGRVIRVGFEPEPGCVVETTAQAVELLSGVDARWLGLCLDLAHLACAWEDPSTALAALRTAGLPIVKVQISAALAADTPTADAESIRQYVEPRFLHQTRNCFGGGADDLDEAIRDGLRGPWRIHYHVPLHAAPAAPLRTTVPVLLDALRSLLTEGDGCDHFDVETYTWNVLPRDHQPETPAQLAAGIAAELAFARAELTALGLSEVQ